MGNCRRLDRKSAVPLYWQLAATLFENLEAGDWRAGTRFATERELEEEFGVSRVVVRKALDFLVADGVIVRRKGAGAFVAPRRQEVRVAGLVQTLLEYRTGLDVKVLTARKELAASTISRVLNLSSSDSVVHVIAVLYREGLPGSFVDAYVSDFRVPWLLPTVQSLQHDQTAPEPGRVELGRAELLIEQNFFGPWGGPQVGAAPGDPASMVRLIQYCRSAETEQDVPLEFARIFYRSDNTQLKVDLNSVQHPLGHDVQIPRTPIDRRV